MISGYGVLALTVEDVLGVIQLTLASPRSIFKAASLQEKQGYIVSLVFQVSDC